MHVTNHFKAPYCRDVVTSNISYIPPPRVILSDDMISALSVLSPVMKLSLF